MLMHKTFSFIDWLIALQYVIAAPHVIVWAEEKQTTKKSNVPQSEHL